MRIIFYAPMKSPLDPTPSGDRTMANLLVKALELAGHTVFILEGPGSYHSDPAHYSKTKDAIVRKRGEVTDWAQALCPDLWVTYHSYYKSPDLFGPWIKKALDIAYVIFEPSYSPKRSQGAWAASLNDALASFRCADLLFVMKEKDRQPLRDILDKTEKIYRFPPFIDPAPFGKGSAPAKSDGQRTVDLIGHRPSGPILLCTAMMRPGKKTESYRYLGRALSHLQELEWHLVIVGDGPERSTIEAEFEHVGPRCTFLGEIPHTAMPEIFALADIFAWPGIGEAFGMVYLEAGAAGLPSVAIRGPGVSEILQNGATGLLTEPESVALYAKALGSLIKDGKLRRDMGAAAQKFISSQRSLDAGAAALAPLIQLEQRGSSCRF